MEYNSRIEALMDIISQDDPYKYDNEITIDKNNIDENHILNREFKALNPKEIDELKKEGFNEQQLEVIKSNYPIVNLAGPGSGKTKTLIAKITIQVENINDLKHMLVLTFTNNAANEILERLSKKLDTKLERKEFYTGTFHGIFYKLLRENSSFLNKNFGFTNVPRVLDKNEDKHLFEQIIQKHLNEDGKAKKTHIKEEFFNKHNIYPMDIYYTINNTINGIPESINHIKQEVVNQSICEDHKELEKLELIVDTFFRSKIMDNVLSFTDILMFTYFGLNKDEELRKKISDNFKYILVDEYQDTNPIQAKIIELISKNDNTCIIGDPYQSIYRFLGASVKNIIDKTKIENMNVIQLLNNYRSTANIVSFTNDVSTLFREKTSSHKPCVSANLEMYNHKIELKRNVNQEANILNSIQYRIKKGIPLNEMAVLARTKNDTYALENVFRRNNIPFIKLGGNELYETKEVKFLIELAKVVSGQYSLQNIENVSDYFKGVGATSLEKVAKLYVDRKDKNITFSDIIKKDFSSSKSLTKFNEVIFGSISQKDFDSDLFSIKDDSTIIRDCSYDSFLDILNNDNLNFYDAILSDAETIAKKKEIETNIEYFKNELQYYFSLGKDELREFLSDISLKTDSNDSEIDKENAVTITTAHSAKGLEWQDVYIINAEQGKFPSYKALDPNLEEDERKKQIEEEKRLFYVAISRAKEKLTITSSGELNDFITPFLNKQYINLYSGNPRR